MTKIEKLIEELNKTKEKLEEEIFDEIEKVAKKHKLDKMIWGYNTYFFRDGEKLSNEQSIPIYEEIREIDDLYDDLHEGGFLGTWTKEKGWN